ncbi:MAG TPA: DUF3343 domain-containing protein [Longimicrobiales bacterium]|nr:DUF3343 domain-containing protein [Longimicrobiales bacterium]
MTRLLTFDTTHHALLAEQLAHDHGFGAEVTIAPAESKAKCDLALEIMHDDLDAVTDVLRTHDVLFNVWR